MKESRFTGAEIYRNIKKLEDEHREICQALDGIEQDTHPYRLLEKARTEKLKELNEAKNAEYTA